MTYLSQIPTPGHQDTDLARGKFYLHSTFTSFTFLLFSRVTSVGGVGGVKPARFVSQERDARQQYTIFKEGGPGYTKYIVYTADKSDRK